ncbi:MAG: TlpA family protein disulfide reductase [Phycisphaerales bacterium]|nr:TlpA family protein disulfide reductase [Phycisphaerales bacterium]
MNEEEPASAESGSRRSGRRSVGLGLISIPLAFIVVGAVTGLIAILFASRSMRDRPGDKIAFLGVLFGALSIGIGSAVGAKYFFQVTEPSLPVDHSAAPVQGVLVALDGTKIDLAGDPNRLTVVDVWATWCAPCIKTIPELESLVRRFPDELRVIGLTFENPTLVKAWVAEREKPIDYPIVSATKSEVPEVFSRIRGYPTLFVIDGTGTVRRTAIGAHDQSALERLIFEVPLKPASTLSKEDGP